MKWIGDWFMGVSIVCVFMYCKCVSNSIYKEKSQITAHSQFCHHYLMIFLCLPSSIVFMQHIHTHVNAFIWGHEFKTIIIHMCVCYISNGGHMWMPSYEDMNLKHNYTHVCLLYLQWGTKICDVCRLCVTIFHSTSSINHYLKETSGWFVDFPISKYIK